MAEQEIGSPVEGPYGRAASFDATSAPATLVAYLIDAPGFHPLWSQYVLSVVTLADVEGVPPATLKFPGATHELLVIALNPDAGPQTVESLATGAAAGRIQYLTPVNIAEQYEATDDEMTQLAWLACRGVVLGALNPETADAPTRIRQNWLTACVKTLAHLRGEEHAP